MASQVEEQSPLIAALPPQTDYITYLTILEYQLTSSNLSTLTSLLTDDDGTLAKEIGWDLLKPILPLSEEVPEEAGKCLEVVARRGNPREVVVRVAEGLEKLDQEANDDALNPDQDFEDDQDDDGLRTFEGEAPRIHLGLMTLDGMPPPSGLDPKNDEHPQHPRSNSAVQTKFQILLSMLSILHPRIQTKHPSRFLATSLPAALGAYRRLPINVTTTTAFVTLLGKLSGKQKPALPPRGLATGTAENPPNADYSPEARSAPLPDPEAENEDTSSSAVSTDEAAIIKCLLQAVLLEVFEEYIKSLAIQEPSSMYWTARLRENREPKRIVPRRQTETEKWRTDPTLQKRDTLITRFVQLSKDLGIDQETVSKQTLAAETAADAAVGEAAAEDAEPPSEYPTSPKQIPFPKTGTFLIFIAQYFVPALADPEAHHDGSAVHQAFLQSTYFLTGIEDSSKLPALRRLSVPVLDFLLATLYTAARARYVQNHSVILLFLISLCDENPDPYIRDSAHASAKTLFRQCAPGTKLGLVKDILKNWQNPHLRAVAVDWLKDDITRKDTSSLSPDLLSTDPGLGDALCALPRAGDLLTQMPFYVAVLNLLTIVPTEQGDWLIHSLAKLRNSMSADEATRIPPVDLWSFDDALQRAKDAFAKQDPASRPV